MPDHPTPAPSIECHYCGRLFDPLPDHVDQLDPADCDEC